MSYRTILSFVMASLSFSVASSSALAQSYPNRTVTLVAPFSPGGALDLVARTMAQKLQEQWGQSVVVENRAGAAGILGTQYVAKASPNGYTILLGATTTHGINPSLYKKLQYDAVADFEPVSLVATIPHLLVVNPSLPINNLMDLAKLSKTKPMAFGSAGIGSPHHLAGEMLKTKLKLDFVHVPYQGSGPALVQLMAGDIDFMSVEVTAAMPHIKSGRIKPIAVASSKRIPSIGLPTFAEQGVSDFEVTAWYAIFAPKNTPKDIVAKISDALAKAVATEDVKTKFAALGATPIGSTPEVLREYVGTEISRWAGAVKSSGATAD